MLKKIHLIKVNALLIILLTFCLQEVNAQQITIINHTLPTAATSCSVSSINVTGRINCNNYAALGNSQSVVGNIIYCDINYAAGVVCTPAFAFFDYDFDFPNLFPGTYDVVIRTYLNGTIQDNETDTFSVVSCCGSAANFTENRTTKCYADSDSFSFTNTSIGATAQEWYVNDILMSTAVDFNPTLDSVDIYTIKLKVTNGTCYDSITKTVEVFTSPTVNLGADIQSCVNSFETLNAGAGQMDYNWSFTTANSQTTVITSTGTYSVEVTNANGCKASDTVEAVFHSLPTVDLGSNINICEFTDLELDAGDFVSYLWNNAATTQTIDASGGGQFSVEVSDSNACKATDNITVTLILAPTIDFGGDTISLCPGDSTELNPGNHSTYLWNTGESTQTITATFNQMYSVEVSNVNNCITLDSVFVNFTTNPVVNLGSDQSICLGDTASFDAGNFAAYLWSNNSSSQTLYIDPIDYALGLNTISVEVTDDNGCKGQGSVNLEVIECDTMTGIATTPFTSEVVLYPNPTKDKLTIDIANNIEDLTITIFNPAGKFLMHKTYANAQHLVLDLEELSKGIYFIQLRNESEVEIQKILKK